MRQLITFCFSLIIGSAASSCGGSKSALSVSRDSLDVVYKELGFYSFCEAVKEDDFLYMVAAAIGENEGRDENVVFKELSAEWAQRHNLIIEQFLIDKNRESMELGRICAGINKLSLDPARPRVKEFFASGQEYTFDDIMYAVEYGHFLQPRNLESEETNTFPVSEDDVTKWMSKYDGSIFEFEWSVKKMLNDPDSFEHVETSGSTKNGAKVKMVFRAKNKLGALVLSTAYADLNVSDGTVSNIRIE